MSTQPHPPGHRHLRQPGPFGAWRARPRASKGHDQAVLLHVLEHTTPQDRPEPPCAVCRGGWMRAAVWDIGSGSQSRPEVARTCAASSAPPPAAPPTRSAPTRRRPWPRTRARTASRSGAPRRQPGSRHTTPCPPAPCRWVGCCVGGAVVCAVLCESSEGNKTTCVGIVVTGATAF